MYLDTRNGSIISSLPQQHVFTNSSHLLIRDGSSTGDFNAMDEAFHIAEGFLPLTETTPEYDARYQNVSVNEPVISEDGESATVDYSVIDKDIDQLKAARCSDVNTLRDQKFISGYSFGGNVYDSTPAAVVDVQGVVLSVVMGVELPENFAWKTADNSYVPMVADDVKGLGVALMNFRTSVYVASWTHKAVINSLETALEVVDYDITEGW